MAKWKRGGYFAALIGTTIIVYAIFFGYYTRTRIFWLTYFPDNSYRPASNLPSVDGQGEPEVVMVRRSGQIECFDVFYSRKLEELLEASLLDARRLPIESGAVCIFSGLKHLTWLASALSQAQVRTRYGEHSETATSVPESASRLPHVKSSRSRIGG
jgi:hypothetical protein